MLPVTRNPSLTLFLLVITLSVLARAQQEADFERLAQLVQDHPEEAISRLQAIVKDSPSAKGYFLLARAWAQVDADQSLVWLERVFSMSPEHKEAWKLWADIMTEIEQYEYAILRLQQQLKQNPDLVHLRLLLAQLYVNTNRLAKAEKEFSGVVEVGLEASDDKTQALYSLGYLYVVSGRIEQGEHLLRQVLDRDSSHVPAMTSLASLLLDTGQWEEAGQLLARLNNTQRGNPEVLLLLGRYYLTEKQWGHAVEILTQLLEKQPDHSKAHFFLGRAYKSQGKLKLAMQHFHTFQELQKKALAERLNRQKGLAVQGAK